MFDFRNQFNNDALNTARDILKKRPVRLREELYNAAVNLGSKLSGMCVEDRTKLLKEEFNKNINSIEESSNLNVLSEFQRIAYENIK